MAGNKVETPQETCSQTIIHEEVVDQVKQTIPTDESLSKVAELFKVLGLSYTYKNITCVI